MTPTTFRRVDGTEFRAWWAETYGGRPGELEPFGFYRRGGKSVWIAAGEIELRGLDPADGVGIPFVRTDSRVWKPTSVAAITFGASATRNVVELSDGEMRAFLRRDAVEFAAEDARHELPNRGFVIARHRRVPIGCGQWGGGGLISCIPKGRMIDPLDA